MLLPLFQMLHPHAVVAEDSGIVKEISKPQSKRSKVKFYCNLTNYYYSKLFQISIVQQIINLESYFLKKGLVNIYI